MLDLLPGLAGAYFARRLPVSLTYGQVRAGAPDCIEGLLLSVTAGHE